VVSVFIIKYTFVDLHTMAFMCTECALVHPIEFVTSIVKH